MLYLSYTACVLDYMRSTAPSVDFNMADDSSKKRKGKKAAKDSWKDEDVHVLLDVFAEETIQCDTESNGHP